MTVAVHGKDMIVNRLEYAIREKIDHVFAFANSTEHSEYTSAEIALQNVDKMLSGKYYMLYDNDDIK